jgi:hypothetical protein
MQEGVGAEDVFGGQAWRDTRIFRMVAKAAFFIASAVDLHRNPVPSREMPMDPNELLTKLPSTPEGWMAWAVCGMFASSKFISKWFAERRGDNKEIERLESALAEERAMRKESDAENRMLSDRINDLVQKFSDQNATNARLEEQMKHLAEQNDALRLQVANLQQSIQGARQP